MQRARWWRGALTGEPGGLARLSDRLNSNCPPSSLSARPTGHSPQSACPSSGCLRAAQDIVGGTHVQTGQDRATSGFQGRSARDIQPTSMAQPRLVLAENSAATLEGSDICHSITHRRFPLGTRAGFARATARIRGTGRRWSRSFFNCWTTPDMCFIWDPRWMIAEGEDVKVSKKNTEMIQIQNHFSPSHSF